MHVFLQISSIELPFLTVGCSCMYAGLFSPARQKKVEYEFPERASWVKLNCKVYMLTCMTNTNSSFKKSMLTNRNAVIRRWHADI